MWKNNFKKSLRFHTLTSFFVGVVFLASGITKLADFYATGFTVEQYFNIIGISISWSYSELIGIIIVAFEVSLGIFLILYSNSTIWLKVAFTILCTFIVINIASIIDGKMLDCGCFGSTLQLTPFQSLIKNLLLAILIIFASIISNRKIIFVKPNFKYFIFTFVTIFISGCIISLFQPIAFSNRYCKGSCLVKKSTNYNDGIVIDWVDDSDRGLHNGHYIIFIIRNIERMSSKDKEFLNQILKYSSQRIETILLSSSSISELKTLNFNPNQIGQVDKSTISQLISSPLGIIILDNGIISNKWQQTYLNIIPSFLK